MPRDITGVIPPLADIKYRDLVLQAGVLEAWLAALLFIKNLCCVQIRENGRPCGRNF
jgi:hypothetical protein